MNKYGIKMGINTLQDGRKIAVYQVIQSGDEFTWCGFSEDGQHHRYIPWYFFKTKYDGKTKRQILQRNWEKSNSL